LSSPFVLGINQQRYTANLCCNQKATPTCCKEKLASQTSSLD
jgi:hypothetical protein